MRAAFREEIPVCWFSYGGWFQGIAEGLPSKHINLRRRQVAIAAQAGLPIAQSMIEGKLRNSRTLLRRNARSDVKKVLDQLKSLAEAVGASESIESLLGMEDTGARLYFSKFSSMIREQSLQPFDFNGRNRRPPRDPVNCLLSYAYALLTKDLTAVAIAVGFDPYLGVLHVLRLAADVGLIDLNRTVEHAERLLIGPAFADAMRQMPCRAIRHPQLTMQLHRAGAFEVGDHQVHRQQPHPEPEIGGVHWGVRANREMLAARPAPVRLRLAGLHDSDVR